MNHNCACIWLWMTFYCIVYAYAWLPIRATIAKPLPDCEDGRRLEGNGMRVAIDQLAVGCNSEL